MEGGVEGPEAQGGEAVHEAEVHPHFILAEVFRVESQLTRGLALGHMQLPGGKARGLHGWSWSSTSEDRESAPSSFDGRVDSCCRSSARS